jgi:hypothetical protein
MAGGPPQWIEIWGWRVVAGVGIALAVVKVFGLHGSAAIQAAGVTIVVSVAVAGIGDRRNSS